MRAAVTGDDAQQARRPTKPPRRSPRRRTSRSSRPGPRSSNTPIQFKDATAKAKEQAKQAADAMARTASQAALYGALALILGALAAFFAGRTAAVDSTLTRNAGVPVWTTERRERRPNPSRLGALGIGEATASEPSRSGQATTGHRRGREQSASTGGLSSAGPPPGCSLAPRRSFGDPRETLRCLEPTLRDDDGAGWWGGSPVANVQTPERDRDARERRAGRRFMLRRNIGDRGRLHGSYPRIDP